MKTSLLALISVIALAVPGCNSEGQPAPDPSQESPHSQAPQEAGPQELDCADGNERQTSFDLGANPHTERSSGAALGVFLRHEKSALQATDFELVKEPGASARFVFSADSKRLASFYVQRIDGGWAVVGYAACPGILRSANRAEKQTPGGAFKLIQNRTDVANVECSRERDFIDDVLLEYPAVDFAAPPSAACVVTLNDGSVFDLLRIRKDWTRIRRSHPADE